MLGKLTTSVALGWLGRRILDWGGWLGTTGITLVTLYNNLPPNTQAAIQRAWQGNWQEITLGSLIPLAALVFSQIQSFRATVKPKIVTTDGVTAPLKEVTPTARNSIEIIAKNAADAAPPIRPKVGKFLREMFGR